MEKVIKYILLGVALLLGNKFIDVYENIKSRELNLDSLRMDLEKKKINLQMENYEMMFTEFKIGDSSIPIMIDKKSGTSYKFFINTENKVAGWESLPFYEKSKKEDTNK